jgi:hypothetical protein
MEKNLSQTLALNAQKKRAQGRARLAARAVFSKNQA